MEGVAMKRTLICFTVVVLMVLVFVSVPKKVLGAGHDGFYGGVGVLSIPMVTWEDRLTRPGGRSERVYFQPGFGGWILFGYQFPDTRWGIQVPLEWQYFKLNHQEWVNQMCGTVEGVVRLVEWDNGIDFHLVGGLGATYLFEGKINDNSSGMGMHAEIGPGFSWFFARGGDVKASLTMEVPIRYIFFFGDHLSRGGTSVFAFPVRLGVTIGF